MPPINNTPALYEISKKEMSKTIQRQQELVLSGQPYKLFIESCRTAKTRETYSSSLKSYMLYRNLFSVELLVVEDPKTAQSQIIEYIRWLREKGLSWQTCVIRAAALKHFYEMNDIVLNWKKINRFVGEKTRTVKDRAYTKEEIRKMLDKCDERKLQIKTLLQNAPRDPDKLERLLKVKERQKDEALYIEDTERLMMEIEMLKVVLHLMVKRRKDSYWSSSFPLTLDRKEDSLNFLDEFAPYVTH
jgi:hypothetical protein